jgi:hypothetical protein
VNERLVNDTVIAMAETLLDLISPSLREEEWRLAFDEFYVVCKAGIEAYCIQQDRLRERLNPMGN